ncbi:MAG TPA: hypothetical protein VKF79_04800 [Candidatus Acidoferrum sp.]|nr:hypothetical protein [Candidatus Acidoferrum sp.]
MSYGWACLLSLLLLADADVPRINNLRAPANETPTFVRGEEVEIFSGAVDAQNPATPQPAADKATTLNLSGKLQDSSRLLLVRYVSGEFAKAVKAMPAGKDGLLVTVGNPVNGEQLERQVATHGAAIKPGDNVQISNLEFRDHQIIVDLNGGGRGKHRLRDRIHIEMSGMPTAQVSTTNPNADAGPPGLQPGQGSTIFLEFNKPIPDLSPDDLKTLLSPFLDFSKQRSASVQWVDTLPPDIKKAIQERQAVVGMDREMVVAAVGKPDHKIRERDADGNDIEDWIYGQPPSKTVFVRFTGDHVTSIKQFPK